MTKSALIISAALLTAVIASAQEPAVPRVPASLETVSVTGSSEVPLTPDRVTFTAGVQTNAVTVDEAVRTNNETTARIVAALKKAGVADKEIRTSNFSLFPQQDYENGRAPRVVGYQVSNNVTVTRSESRDIGKLLQVAVEAGANQVSGISFIVSDPSRGRDQGLRGAFDDARAKADLLAKASGRRLGRALSITEGGAAPPPPIPRPQAMMVAQDAKVGEVPVESGTEQRQFVVSVVFALE